MSIQDPIADMLTRIRNAQMIRRSEVSMPSSKRKIEVLKVLEEEGYIEGFTVANEGVKSQLKVRLKYFNHGFVIEIF